MSVTDDMDKMHATVEGNPQREGDEKRQLEFPVTGTMTQEEKENYWRAVDATRRELNNLESDVLRQKCLYHCSVSLTEIAERTAASMTEMECKPTGRRRLIIDWIDLRVKAEYEKWASGGETPVVHEPLWEDED